MTLTSVFRTRIGLLCGAGVFTLGLLNVSSLFAQRSMFSAAGTRASLRPVAAQGDAEPGAPEPPQAAQTTPPVKDDLFAGTEKFAKGASDVTEVTMDPNSLDMVGGPDANRAHRMILNVVRTYSYDKPGMFNPADVEEYRHKLEGGDWHCSVHIRDLKNGDSTDVCSRHRAPDMVENAIITVSPKSLTFIHNIRKANGQGGGLDMGGFPGMSMMLPGVPMALSFRIAQPVMAAEMMASTAALRAQMPGLVQGMNTLALDLPEQMRSMKDGMKNFRLEIPPGQSDDFRHLEQQLQDLEKQVRPQQDELQQLRNQLRELQKNAPLQP